MRGCPRRNMDGEGIKIPIFVIMMCSALTILNQHVELLKTPGISEWNSTHAQIRSPGQSSPHPRNSAEESKHGSRITHKTL